MITSSYMREYDYWKIVERYWESDGTCKIHNPESTIKYVGIVDNVTHLEFGIPP